MGTNVDAERYIVKPFSRYCTILLFVMYYIELKKCDMSKDSLQYQIDNYGIYRDSLRSIWKSEAENPASIFTVWPLLNFE